jgi:hypothetical protein
MSFIKNLLEDQKGKQVLDATRVPRAINRAGATDGLASTVNNFRELHRVSGPINSAVTPAVRNRMLYS